MGVVSECCKEVYYRYPCGGSLQALAGTCKLNTQT